MTALNHRWRAGGAQLGVVKRRHGETGGAGGIVWIARDRPHVGSRLSRLERSRPFKVGFGGLSQMHGKAIPGNLSDRFSQSGNGVVRRRERAVTALVRHLEGVRLVKLLARLQRTEQSLSVLDQRVTRVDVERVLGVDQSTMVRHQPRHRVVAAATFFTGSERKYQRSLGYDVLAFHAQQRGGESSRSILDVAGAAPVKEAIFFGELEGIERPVRWQCFDYVEMRDQQDRLERLRGPLYPHDYARILVACGADDRYITRRETGINEASGNRVRGR